MTTITKSQEIGNLRVKFLKFVYENFENRAVA